MYLFAFSADNKLPRVLKQDPGFAESRIVGEIMYVDGEEKRRMRMRNEDDEDAEQYNNFNIQMSRKVSQHWYYFSEVYVRLSRKEGRANYCDHMEWNLLFDRPCDNLRNGTNPNYN